MQNVSKMAIPPKYSRRKILAIVRHNIRLLKLIDNPKTLELDKLREIVLNMKPQHLSPEELENIEALATTNSFCTVRDIKERINEFEIFTNFLNFFNLKSDNHV